VGEISANEIVSRGGVLCETTQAQKGPSTELKLERGALMGRRYRSRKVICFFSFSGEYLPQKIEREEERKQMRMQGGSPDTCYQGGEREKRCTVQGDCHDAGG